MNRKKAINSSFIFLSIAIFGCQSSPIETKFTRDIPKHKYEATKLLEGVRATGDSLGLDNLENGYDSLQIRLWFTYRSDSEQVLIIRRKNAHWYGNFGFASFSLPPRGDSISRYTIHYFKPILRSDWSDIVDTL